MFKPTNKLNFGIAKNDSIVSSIQAITRDLGQWMYTNHYNDFTFDETKLGRTKGLYSAQNEQVVLNKQANKEDLVETIKDIITDDLKLVVDSVEFELNTSGVYKNLYNQTVKIPVSDNGFVENAIFLKNDEVSESDLENMFNQDMGDSLKTSTFMNDSKATILNNLNIEVDLEKNNAEYSEYGYISLSSMTINIQGLKVDVNPINLLYVYKPTKTIATKMISTLKAWQSAWNIKKTEDRYALFKMSEENSELNSQIWTSIAVSPSYFLNNVNKEKNKYYGQILETSAFNDFYINHKFLSGWWSRAAVDSKGYSMDYQTGFGGAEKYWYKHIWELYFNFDEFKLQLDFTNNVSYKENLWYGSNKGKYAIEK